MAFSSSRGFGPAPEGTSQNFPPRVPNSFEPLGGSARLISRTGQQGQELTAPIGAHAPPIPCADQSDPPGFPRPGGSVLFVGEFPLFSVRPTAEPTVPPKSGDV